MNGVGIKAIGVWFPDEIRENSFWGPELVAQWRKRGGPAPPKHAPEPYQEFVDDARAQYAGDPFQGSRLRHVSDPEVAPSHLGIEAAMDAIERAGVAVGDIGLLLTQTSVPDQMDTNPACTLHHALGLRPDCFSLAVEGACNSFQMMSEMAADAIRLGRTKYALVVQWCAVTRLLPNEAVYAPWFGDGAAAVVYGPVQEGYGLLSATHRTDGSLQDTLVAGVPGGRWYDEGRAVLHPANMAKAGKMFACTAAYAAQTVPVALQKAGLDNQDVDFYACHQGTAWIREATQKAAGLNQARSHDTFPTRANLGSPNIPVVLREAEDLGLLKPGDVVATHAGGSGITYSSLVMRWGDA